MGFSTRLGTRFPFAPKCAAVLFYALISSALAASVIPISWSGNRPEATVLAVAEETQEVTGLLAINTCRVGGNSLLDPGLGNILQDAGALSGSGEPMGFKGRVLAGFGSDEPGSAIASVIPEFLAGNFAGWPAIGVARFGANRAIDEAAVARFVADRGVDLWSSGGGSVPPSDAPVTYPSAGTFHRKTWATQSGTAMAFLDDAGSPVPEGITAIFTWDGGGADNNYGGLLTLAGATTLASDSGTLNLTNTGTITGATFGLTLTGTGSISSIIGTTSGSLTKSGTGTWILSGANTFTGATTVNGGTLTLANSSGSALGFTSGITVNSGATLFLGADNQINNLAQITLAGGTFRRGNFSEGTAGSAGVGMLSLTAGGSHLDFGTGLVGILTFASFAAGGNNLIIDNWSGTAATLGTSALTDRLIFASNQSGNLGSFNFTGFGPGAVQFDLGNGYFEIVPVPEAETCFSVSIVLALILLHHRKQLRQSVLRWRASRRLRFSATHGTGVAS